MSRRLLHASALAIGMLAGACSVSAKTTLSVAAAANLVYALEALNAEFERAHPDVTVQPTTGASGNLFAQLKHGAPFDVFLSADADYPRQVIAANLGEVRSVRTFAVGRLVLWTTRDGMDVSDVVAAVRAGMVKKIALAQPKTAPYGRAAQVALEELGAWNDVQPKLVFGESISQTAQFVETGNADLGFVAMSLVVSPQLAEKGRWHEVPAELYARVPLDHVGVLTLRGAKNPVARQYLDFLASVPAQKILRKFGYGIP